MKRQLSLAAFIIATVLCAAMIGMPNTGCTQLQVAAGQDPIVVNAERSVAAADDTINTFLNFEFDNSAIIKARAPAVHEFAETLRAQNKDGTAAPGSAAALLADARGLTKLYQQTKSAADAQNAVDAVSAVEELARQARLKLIAAQTAKART